MRSSSCLLLLLLALPAFAAPQTPTIPHAGESLEVSIVNVDAVVVDKQGHRVQGLRRDDFDIYENGVRQPITNFAEYTAARAEQSAAAGVTAPASAPQQPPPPPQQRSIIVFVERFRLPSFRSDPLFGALKKLLHDSVRPGDRVMVVSWNHGVVGMRQNFTDDLAKVDTALDALAVRTKTVTLNPIDDLRQEIDAIAAFEKEGAGFQKFGFSGSNQLGASNLPFFAEQTARMSAKVELADERQKVDTLKALMRAAASVEGKKVLLLATHRLSMYAGAETLFVGGTDTVPAEFRNEFDARPLIKSLVETANANGFTIYPIYAEGLDSTSMPSADMRRPLINGFDYLVLNNETPMLEYVAKETGGMTAWGSTDVTNLLPRIGDDIESYYSLAYRATPGKAASRKVEVRTRDPKLSVRSRRQFVPKNEVVRMEDRVIGALFGNVPESAFQFAVTSEPPKRDREKSYLIPVTVQVPISALTPLRGQDDVYNGAFSVYMAWGSTIGGVSATHHDTQQFSISAADLERAKKGHYTYTISVASLTPSLHVAFGVYDEVSRDYAVRLVDLESPSPEK